MKLKSFPNKTEFINKQEFDYCNLRFSWKHSNEKCCVYILQNFEWHSFAYEVAAFTNFFTLKHVLVFPKHLKQTDTVPSNQLVASFQLRISTDSLDCFINIFWSINTYPFVSNILNSWYGSFWFTPSVNFFKILEKENCHCLILSARDLFNNLSKNKDL